MRAAFLVATIAIAWFTSLSLCLAAGNGVVKRDTILDFLWRLLGGGGSSSSASDTNGSSAPSSDGRVVKSSSDTPAVSQTILDLYAAYSGAAYKVTDTWNCDVECQQPGTDGTEIKYHWDTPVVTSTGYVAHNPNTNVIVVAFRGSSEFGDWMQDFAISPTSWPSDISGSNVVSGFLSGYLVASPLVLQNVVELATQYPSCRIVATGHSLGGSRASLFVADLTLRYPKLTPRVYLYTYGQAKCGNQVFSQYMDTLGVPIFREVNRGDIAPHLPFENENPYVHFGTEAWVNLSNQTVFCKTGEYGHCSASLSPTAYNLADHSTYKGL